MSFSSLGLDSLAVPQGWHVHRGLGNSRGRTISNGETSREEVELSRLIVLFFLVLCIWEGGFDRGNVFCGLEGGLLSMVSNRFVRERVVATMMRQWIDSVVCVT